MHRSHWCAALFLLLPTIALAGPKVKETMLEKLPPDVSASFASEEAALQEMDARIEAAAQQIEASKEAKTDLKSGVGEAKGGVHDAIECIVDPDK